MSPSLLSLHRDDSSIAQRALDLRNAKSLSQRFANFTQCLARPNRNHSRANEGEDLGDGGHQIHEKSPRRELGEYPTKAGRDEKQAPARDVDGQLVGLAQHASNWLWHCVTDADGRAECLGEFPG